MERALIFQYSASKTQQARIEIPAAIGPMVPPRDVHGNVRN
jgi:hypothetical protein